MRSLTRYFSPSVLSAFAFTGLIASNANSAISTNDELHSLLYNGDFTTQAANWISSNGWVAANTMNIVANGSTYCTTITARSATAQVWDFATRQENLKLEPGHTYTIKGKVWSTASAPAIRAGLDLTASPYTPFSSVSVIPIISGVALATDNLALTYIHPATSAAVPGVHFGFQLGALPVNSTVCFDDLVVFDSQFTKPAPRAPKKVVVNQVGYLTNLDKFATYIVPSSAANKTTARTWVLKKAGVQVKTGVTVPLGTTADTASGDFIHNIKFSDVTTVGSGYTLEVTEGTGASAVINSSYPFKIGGDIYSTLKYDALAYFYHNRSGIAVDTAVVGAPFGHVAWHAGDASLSTNFDSRTGINAANGWYDAGDHGKYVVNGGISVWTMLNQYERAKYLGANSGDFADGTMKLPASERTNNMPDILDEARWEVEWMLRMQIPQGQVNAGMVYHKLHNDKWTSMPYDPADPTTADPTNLRHIWAPSTAATLNMAAVGAQCYRTYKTVDPVLAKKCLDQAVLAYTAAKNNPNKSAPVTAGSDGGGPYGDANLQDEFYWAATELYLATNDPAEVAYNSATYAADMQSSNLHLIMPTAGKSSMSWADTAGLGIISLATAGPSFGANTSWVTTARSAIAARATTYATSTESSYGTPFDSSATLPVSWGSNSDVLNNIIVMGLARDFYCPTGTPDIRLSNSIQNGMNYLLGRNPLDYSYITGYGSDPVKHPHHRFWAFFATPPAGVVVGGPNGLIDAADITGFANLAGCLSLKCYMDNLAIYSTNEVTINWNAPLAWSAAYLDEMGSGKKPQACGGVNAQNGSITVTTGSTGSTDLKALNNGQPGDIYTVVGQPTKGTVTITNGVATYTGGTSFTTSDSFTYTITRAGVVSLPATITVTKQVITTASCAYKVTQDTNSWNNSWVAQLVIQNTTSSPLSSWSVDLAYPTNLLGSWGNPGSYDANVALISTGNYRLTNKPWNGTIPVGGSLMIAINGTSGPTGNGSPATPAEVATISGTTCGLPLTKTVRFHSDHQYSIIYGTDAIVRMGGTNIRYFNNTTTPDNNLIFKIDSIVLPNFIYTQNCCRGALYPEVKPSPSLLIGYHTMTLTTGSASPQETDTVNFLLTNAKAECSITGTQNGSNWTATVKVVNNGYHPGSIAQYYFEPAQPSDLVYKGKNWEAVLSWQEQVYPNSGAISIPRNITSTDGKTRVKEKLEISGDGSNRYIYYFAPADFIGEIAGRAANAAPASYSFNISGTGIFFLPGSLSPQVGCDFGKLPSY